MTAQCLISFGSNLGSRDALIAQAARTIADSHLAEDFRTSRLFETPPIGGPQGQEPFLNAVASFDTRGSARQILELLQHTECQLGRQRRQRWDARSIDLDVVLHGQLVGGGTGLIVPHPRYTARQFVLQPACDVAAQYRDPRFGWSLERLAHHLDQGVPSLALVGSDQVTREVLCQRLRDEHAIETFAAGPLTQPMSVVGNAPSALQPRDPTAKAIDPDGDDKASPGQGIVPPCDRPWVSAFIPPLPPLQCEQTSSNQVPRLVARMQSTTPQTRWPAPHQMWPAGWQWPEYRLEVDDLDWAVSEIVSALDSMRCPVEPVTNHGDWWK